MPGDYDLWVSEDRKLMVRVWREIDKAEAATRDDPGHTWGPPIKLERERGWDD